MTETNLSTKQKQAHRYREQTCDCQEVGRWGRDRVGVQGKQIPTIGLPWWLRGKKSTCQCSRDKFSLGGGNVTTLQYSCLGKLMDRRAWQATVHGVAKSQTRLRDFTFFLCALNKKYVHFFFPSVCHMACGILVLQPGVKPMPPAVEAWSFNPWTAREVPVFKFGFISQSHLFP